MTSFNIQTLHRVHYRARQFWAALRPKISAEERRLVEQILAANPKALAIFKGMAIADQQHAIAVLQALPRREQLAEPPPTYLALQQAALLHDTGKTLGQPLFHRVLVVLLKTFWPAGLEKLAAAPLTCPVWRRPFVINVHHPDIGADWAEQAGCARLTVTLIRSHQEKPADRPSSTGEKLHQALYEADGAN